MSKVFWRLVSRSPILSNAFTTQKVGNGNGSCALPLAVRAAEDTLAVVRLSNWSPQAD